MSEAEKAVVDLVMAVLSRRLVENRLLLRYQLILLLKFGEIAVDVYADKVLQFRSGRSTRSYGRKNCEVYAIIRAELLGEYCATFGQI